MSNEYAKVSIPRPLFDRLKSDRITAMGFRSPSDAVTHATRKLLDEAERGVA